jgi:hypothetical protein
MAEAVDECGILRVDCVLVGLPAIYQGIQIIRVLILRDWLFKGLARHRNFPLGRADVVS